MKYLTNGYGLAVFPGSFKVEKLLFSSRRRHTRLQGDWSSDVCSSDLDQVLRLLVEARVHVVARLEDGLAPGARDVRLAVVLGGEDGADRLPLLVGEGDAEVGEIGRAHGLNSSHLGTSYAVFGLK